MSSLEAALRRIRKAGIALGPWIFVGPVSRFLERHDFPSGATHMPDWGIKPHRWFRDGQEHKSSSLARLMEDMPHVTWVLVGDEGEHDPKLYSDLATPTGWHPSHYASPADHPDWGR